MTSHPFLLCANWKMHKNPWEAKKYFQTLKTHLLPKDHEYFVFFVPALTLAACAEEVKNSALTLGGQNCYPESQGAFTGENSPQTLQDMGAGFCLVGHSERRGLFKETDTLICQKVKALLKHSLCPVLCVGENQVEREKGMSFEVVRHQLRCALDRVSFSESKKLSFLRGGFEVLIAYEPVWAIGSGLSAKAQDIKSMCQFIRREVKNLLSFSPGVLYGGSVNNNNIKELCLVTELDGLLVGGYSLNPLHFASLLTEVKRHEN